MTTIPVLATAAFLVGAASVQAVEVPEPGRTATFRIVGQELTGERHTVEADGSVRTFVETGLDGVLYHREANKRVPAHVLVSMAITVKGDELLEAGLTYTDFGRAGYTVTIQIDPCWFELVNGREATADAFGADVVAKLDEAAGARAVEPCLKAWLTQRLSQLAARMAMPYVKGGVTLMPPTRS
jgi:hypothetical protein